MIDQFIQNLLDTTWLEFIAVVFGFASVWFAKKENILVYPTGIISVLIYVYICFFAKLYADMAINFFYFAMSIYGWYMWSRIDEQKKPPLISFAGLRLNIIMIASAVVMFFLFRFILIHYTDSNVPNIDSLTTAIFVVAMYLMATKKVENWIAWIIADLISIPLYFYKGLVFTSFQYLGFLVLAILGYIEWKRKAELSKNA